MKKIILNRIKTPDGTILISEHRNHLVKHKDKNGITYVIDGGNDFLRRTEYAFHPYEEMTIYEDDSFDIIRENYSFQIKKTKKPLKNLKISEINEIIKWAIFDNNVIVSILKKEIEYRNGKQS